MVQPDIFGGPGLSLVRDLLLTPSSKKAPAIFEAVVPTFDVAYVDLWGRAVLKFGTATQGLDPSTQDLNVGIIPSGKRWLLLALALIADGTYATGDAYPVIYFKGNSAVVNTTIPLGLAISSKRIMGFLPPAGMGPIILTGTGQAAGPRFGWIIGTTFGVGSTGQAIAVVVEF